MRIRSVAVTVLSLGVLLGAAPADASVVSWRAQHPVQPAHTRAMPSGISCATATSCVLVANTVAFPDKNTAAPLWGHGFSEVRSANGAWHIVSLPARPAVFLNGVSCTSATFCMAVGSTKAAPGHPISERWDGHRWTVIPFPHTSTSSWSGLDAVSCLSASFCVAVGEGAVTGTGFNLIGQWNGHSWSTTRVGPRTTDPAHTVAWLLTVSCASTTFCYAGGESYNSTSKEEAGQGLLFNGHGWRSFTPPARPTSAQAIPYVSSVSCPAPHACYVVADFNLVFTNGRSWKRQHLPVPANSGYVEAVACASATRCVASAEVAGEISESLMLSWDGHTWTRQSLDTGTATLPDTPLRELSCRRAGPCIAAGNALANHQAALGPILIQAQP